MFSQQVPTNLGASTLLMNSSRGAPAAVNTQTDRPMTVQDYGKWQRELVSTSVISVLLSLQG